MDNQQCANDGLRELALFAGAGGGILGGKLLGWRTVCAVEIEPYPASVLAQRQNDGILAPFPIWDDIRTFDGLPWRGRVEVVSGGFPCQDISCAGKGAGITGERSGLWMEMARIIGEVRPQYAFVENSPVLTSRGLGTVLGDLSEMGYDARWGIFSACAHGASHTRERLFVVANSHGIEWDCMDKIKKTGYLGVNTKNTRTARDISIHIPIPISRVVSDRYSKICRNDDGLAEGMVRLKAIGNGQVPQVAAYAFELLKNDIAQ